MGEHVARRVLLAAAALLEAIGGEAGGQRRLPAPQAQHIRLAVACATAGAAHWLRLVSILVGEMDPEIPQHGDDASPLTASAAAVRQRAAVELQTCLRHIEAITELTTSPRVRVPLLELFRAVRLNIAELHPMSPSTPTGGRPDLEVTWRTQPTNGSAVTAKPLESTDDRLARWEALRGE